MKTKKKYVLEPTYRIKEIERRMQRHAEKAVQEGAALLDEHNPGWEDRINPADLVMANTNHCILGQVYGGYNNGLSQVVVREDKAWEVGFNSPDPKQVLTTRQFDIMEDFEQKSYDAILELSYVAQGKKRAWDFTRTYFALLSRAWRDLLVSRGYKNANHTPFAVLIEKEEESH